MIDLCIIGAGASGMSAAIKAKNENPKLNILILEKKESPGKKIIASGNGKCNLSNEKCPGHEDILRFFNKLGVITRTDSEGRIYPYTEESKAVVSAMVDELKRLGVDVKCSINVESIKKTDFFLITSTKGETFQSKNLLISAGGKAAPKLGTTGDGYKWARNLGHSVSKLVPALTAIDVREDTKDFAGVRAKGKVTLFYDEREIFSEHGEIQFTKDAISGIAVFNMSRFLTVPEGKTLKDGFDDYVIELDFLPAIEDVKGMLEYRRAKLGFKGKELLKSIVRASIAQFIIKQTGDNLDKMAEALHHFKLHPCGAKGWDFAQVTKGGVPLDEVNLDTMESKVCPGLYFAGEILDFDGPCGGYNLQNAFETGIKAGRTIGHV